MISSGEALAILPLKQRSTMYKTEGVDAIATITEVRSQTSELIDQVQGSKRGIMIQRNNDPQAVLISWDLYKKIKDRVDLQNL
ncbi:type II toxin-antitoxin system Phd/YefM family antitoxin [Longibacter sp.]|jgi:prevent-host-death family protein|uniref:type II toxin-antitoxin system Phd/YefM family antitoxin n=1 Tax=Longibacter sp. TaxID=2045415 RepID=UPI003EC09B8A